MTPPDTIGSTLIAVSTALAEVGFDEPRRRARRVVAAALGLSATEVFAHLDRMVSESEVERIAAVRARILAHEPLTRILGMREFWGRDFLLSSDTLDPRPESETLVEAVLARLPDRDRSCRILDLGTGTGCLLLSLLAEYKAASGVGIDRASGAVVTARRNAERLGLAHRAAFAVGNWAGALAGRFDIVVANPPYIASGDIPMLPREVREFDPHRGLDGGVDGLEAYRAIAPQLARLLTPGGVFAGEIGQGQNEAVVGIISAHTLVIDAVVPDLAGIPRCVVARPAGEGAG